MKIINILIPVTFSILLSSCAGLYSPNTAQVVDGTNNTNTNVSNQLLVNNQVQLGKPEIISHYVVKGDTLYNISKRYNAGINDIIVLNNIQNNNIMLGQNLKIRTNTSGNTAVYNSNQPISQPTKPIVNQHQYNNNINPYSQDYNGKNYDDNYVGTKESYSSNNKVNNYLLKTNNKSSNPTFLSRYAPKF